MDANASFLPCLLERWERWHRAAQGELQVRPGAGNSWADVHRDVVRNLGWLLNSEAITWCGPFQPGLRTAFPDDVADSVLGFGMPPYSGQTQSRINGEEIARSVERRILAFEPRIDAGTLEVVFLPADQHRFNTLALMVRGHLRSDPLTAFELRTEIDLEAGKACVLE